MKKFNKIIAMGCAAVMACSIMSINAFATEDISYKNTEVSSLETNEIFIPADAPVGTEYDLGNGLIYKVIDRVQYDKIKNDALRESMLRSAVNTISAEHLYGKSYTDTFELDSTYRYWHVAMCNNQSTSYSTLMSVFYPDGDIYKSLRVQGGGSAGNLGWLYSTSSFGAGTYTFQLSSLYTLSGSAYGKIGTSASDVVYDG